MADALHIVVMNSGGLRSLVATALALDEQEGEERGVRVSLLHLVDGRDNASVRRERVRQQADHFGITRIGEIRLRHLYGTEHGRTADGALNTLLSAPQMLLTAMDYAQFHQAQRLVWPQAVNGEVASIAHAAEQMQLIEHLGDVAGSEMPQLVAPLLEMTDQQMVELGASMDLPWSLGWSCQRSGDLPCGGCGACRRRRSAFEAGGLEDPIDKSAMARR